MHTTWKALIIVALVAGLAATAPCEDQSPADGIVRRLRREFVERLTAPDTYKRQVQQECAGFPEGDLFSYTFPAMALARSMPMDPQAQLLQRQAIGTCLDLAIASTAKHLRAPQGDLLQVAEYGRQGTYLGGLALALSAWRQAGGDDRYDQLEDHCCDLLATALTASAGAGIASFPSYTWTFDTIPALVAVHHNDQRRGMTRGVALVSEHLAWLERCARDPVTGLPASIATAAGPVGPPRGCELSWRIALIGAVDQAAMHRWYAAYAQHFWQDRVLYAGFREYPQGSISQEDRDSGPIFDGIGLTATGFGVAATRMAGDVVREQRLIGQLGKLPQLRQLMASQDPQAGRASIGHLDDDAHYVSGFLYGDVSCFYALTWPRPAK